MLTLLELGPRQCRYSVTPSSPHFFCAEPTDGRPYCPEHDALCHDGKKVKDWRGLAGMIDATEQTVIHRRPKEEGPAPRLDDVLAGAADYFDEAGGLMRRM